MKKSLIPVLMSAALAAALSVAPTATAKGPGGPPTGGEETAANNLSVPAVFVPNSGGFGLSCGLPAVPPSGTPLTGYYVDPSAYYYVQGTHTWQAQCLDGLADGSVHATADWGDNLTGAPLKAGTPIRVEVGLLETTPTALTGFTVVKLDDALDRVSAYGTQAVADSSSTTGFSPVPVTPYPEVRVWDSQATLSIYSTTGTQVYDGPAAAEINATGRVTYGYNWGTGKGRAATAAEGDYVITFTAPSVTVDNATDGHTVSLTVHVAAKKGGRS